MKGRKNFIPIKPNSSDISEIEQVLKKHPGYTFKYKKEWPQDYLHRFSHKLNVIAI